MIRHFEPEDLKKIKVNRFSVNDQNVEDITNEHYYKNTFVDGPDVVCIVAFRRYWQDNFLGFLILSDDFTPRHGREVRTFIHQAMKDFNCKRLQTDSEACAVLDRWHEFLGFKLEGTREKLIMGKDFRMWAIVPRED